MEPPSGAYAGDTLEWIPGPDPDVSGKEGPVFTYEGAYEPCELGLATFGVSGKLIAEEGGAYAELWE